MGNVFIVCTFDIDVMHRTKHQEVLFKAYLLQLWLRLVPNRHSSIYAYILVYFGCLLRIYVQYFYLSETREAAHWREEL